MRYSYAAQGMGGGSKGSISGAGGGSGWASIWEGTLDGDASDYETVHHEIMHGCGYSHGSGMTYGWSHALRKVVEKLYAAVYAEREDPVFQGPKYVFDIKKLSDKQLQITVHKTSLATDNEVTLQILASTPNAYEGFAVRQHFEDDNNQLTIFIEDIINSRFFLRLYGSDSVEIMSRMINPSDWLQTQLFTDVNTNKRYDVISHSNWVKSADIFEFPMQPNYAPTACQMWFGENSFIAYRVDADLINSDYRSLIDDAHWLDSKKLLGRNNSWYSYRSYDYSDGNYVLTSFSRTETITDDTLGILCATDVAP